MTLSLRAMTAEEYGTVMPALAESYAASLVATGRLTLDRARAESAHQVEMLLPDGVRTTGMLLLAGEVDGARVGWIWVGLPNASSHPDSAWIYNVEIGEAHRGKGYGRALMQAAEQELVRQGVTRVGLNVFGDNTAATQLYRSLGYRVTSLQMVKPLLPG